MLNRNNHQSDNDFIAQCDDCGHSFYVHPPDNNLRNHTILAQRHSGKHNHECSVLDQIKRLRVYDTKTA